MKKYIIKASQTIHCYYETEIEAKNQKEAEKIAFKTPLSEWDDEKTENADQLSVDEIEEVA